GRSLPASASLDRNVRGEGGRPMNDPARLTSESLPPELAPHVDPVCRAFEAAWKAGQRPAIEDFLRDISPPVRARLFRELLRFELAYRTRDNEKPTLEEYRLRFPEEGDWIGSVFRDTPTGVSLPEPSPLPGVSTSDGSAGEPADWPAIPGYE